MVAKEGSSPTPIRWFRLFLIAAGILFLVFIWAWFSAYRDLPETVDRVLKPNLALTESITIRPSDYSSLLEKPVTITNKNRIGKFASTIASARVTSLNHPHTNWRCCITVKDSEGTSHCTVFETPSQGVLITVHTGQSDGWMLGTYRCDAMGPLLEQWAK